MSTSTIILFKKTTAWKIFPQNLFMVDDIESFLSAVSGTNKVSISNVQYIKHGLEIELRLDMSQTYANPLQQYAYVSIKNSDDTKTYYYFIKKVEWGAYSTCKFTLVMDVLNSIKYGTDYTLSPKTKINRQHKNRLVKKTTNNSITTFIKFDAGYPVDIQDYLGTTIQIVIDDISATTFSVELIAEEYTGANNIYELILDYHVGLYSALVEFVSSDVTLTSSTSVLIGKGTIESGTIANSIINYYRKIDFLSEQIPSALYHDIPNDQLIKNPDNDSDWYLIYATDNVPTTTELNNPLRCYLCTDKNLIVQPNQPLVQGRIYPEMLEEGKYYYFLGSSVIGEVVTLSNLTTISVESQDILTIYKCGKKIIVNFYDTNFTTIFGYASTDYISITNDLTFAYSSTLDYKTYPSGSPTKTFYYTAYPQVTLDTIEDLDRTNSKIVKVIKLPYAPYNFTYSGTTLIIPDEWEFGVFEGKNFLKLKDLNTKFNYTFISDVDNINSLLQLTGAPDYTQVRNDYFESKIYHSDYYIPKVVYDSFAFAFNLEKISLADIIDTEMDDFLKVTFTCTTTINSRFMLRFPQYKCRTLGIQDYNNVLPIVRNNEIALYNIPYLNYIRNGYNYDVKTKNRQNMSNWLGAGLGFLGTLAMLASAPTNPISLVMGVGMAASTIKSLVSTISSQAQAEQNIQAKLQEASAQGASVSGSDDVDLMSEYTSNRASIMTYQSSDIMRNLLFDLFYYTGYNDNTMNTPVLTTRKWFNFVSCEAIIEPKIGISEEIQQELISLWKSGITNLHKVDNTWDFAQEKENAEVSIEEV